VAKSGCTPVKKKKKKKRRRRSKYERENRFLIGLCSWSG
jgi:hypothetical protein